MSDGNKAAASLDVNIRLQKQGDGLTQTTAEMNQAAEAAKKLATEVDKVSQATEKVKRPVYSPSGSLGAAPAQSTGGGDAAAARARLAGYPMPGDAPAEAKIAHLSGDEIARTQKLVAQLERVITVKRVLGQSYEAEAAAVQKARTALAPYQAELDRRAKMLLELKKNQEEETAETEKASDKKKKLGEALRGLSTEFPALGQVIRAITSPLGLVSAAAAILTSKATDYINQVEELAKRAEAFGRLSERVDPLAVLQENAGAARDALLRTYEEIGRSVNSLNAHYSELNSTLLLQQQLMQKLDDADLAKGLAGVDARLARGEITQSQANRERARLNQDALTRRDAREIDAIEQQRKLEAARASAAEFAQGSLEPRLTDTQQAVIAQEIATQKARVVAEETASQAELRLGPLREKKGLVDTVLRGQGGPIEAAKLLGSGTVPDDATAQRLQDEINQVLQEVLKAKQAAAKEERRLADLKADEAAIMKQLTDLEQAQLEAARRAEQLGKEVQLRRETQTQVEATRKQTAAIQQGAADFGETRAAQVRELKAQLEQIAQQRKILGEDNPRQATLQRAEAELRNRIELLQARPEERRLIEEQNRTRTIGTEREIFNDGRERFKRENRGEPLAPSLPGGLADPDGALSPIGREIERFGTQLQRSAEATVKSVSRTNAKLAEIATRMEALETRVNNGRVGGN